MSENWELSLLRHYIRMRYFQKILAVMLQTFQGEQKATTFNGTSSIFCIKMEMLLQVTPKKNTPYLARQP